MKARLVRIGNSRGIRLPKPIIEQAGLTDEVEIKVHDSAVVIASAAAPRTGWEAAAKDMQGRGDDQILDPPTSSHFDDKEWEW